MQVRPVTDTKCISKIINEILNNNGLSQKDLAEKLGVTRNMIPLYVNGTSLPSMYVIRKLHKKFHISYEAIFGEEEMNKTFIKYSSLTQKDQELIDALVERLSSKP